MIRKLIVCSLSIFFFANTSRATTFYLKNNNPTHNWNDACNWYTNPLDISGSDCFGVPGPLDHVVIKGHSFIALQNATIIASLHMDNGYGWIYGNHPLTILGTARVEGMAIQNNGKINILGNLYLQAGSLGGSDTAFVHGTTFFDGAGIVARTLCLGGGGEWRTNNIGISYQGKLVLPAGKILQMNHLDEGASMYHASGGHFHNYGFFQKNSLHNLTLGATMVCNGGEFHFTHGTTAITNNMTLANAEVHVSNQTYVDFQNGSRTWTNSQLHSNGTVRMKGANNFAADCAVTLDTLVLFGSGGASFHLPMSIPNLVMTGGASFFYENSEITQSFWWFAGHLYGDAIFEVQPLAHLVGNGGNSSYTSCKFNFLSGAEWTGGNFEMNSGAEFNFPDGQDFLINLSATRYISINSNAPYGKITLSPGSILTKNGTGAAWLDVVVNSDESVFFVNDGTLSLWQGTHDHSYFWMNTERALQCTHNGNNFNFCEITGPGIFRIYNWVTTLANETTLDCHLEITGGTLTANSEITPIDLKLTAGTLNGTANIFCQGDFLWGTVQAHVQGSGILDVQGFTTISGSAGRLLSKEIVMHGGGSWSGTLYLGFGSTGILRVPAGATFTLSPTATCNNTGTQSATCGIIVEGTLVKTTNFEFDFQGADFTNNGSVHGIGDFRTWNYAFAHPNTGNLSPGIPGATGTLRWNGLFENKPSGNLIFEFQQDEAGTTADSMHFLHNLVLGGTLTVVADPCWMSFSKTIISWAGTRTGSFANVVLPADYALVVDDAAKKIRIVHTFLASAVACPAAAEVETDAGTCTATGVELGMPTVENENCAAGFSFENDAPDEFDFGSTTVTWTATAANGSTSVCTQSVNVTSSATEICNEVDDDCDSVTDEGCGDGPTISISFSTVAPTCFGNSNGTIFSTVSGGTAPYTFAWSNGKTTQNINLLTAGNYTLTATDANGTTGTATAELTQPTAINFTLASVADGSNFDVTVSPTGGTPNYTFWRTGMSNFQTSEVLQDLPAGSYIFKVKDANGCQKSRIKAVPIVGSKPAPTSNNSLTESELSAAERDLIFSENFEKLEVSLAPNPFSDRLTLRLTADFEKDFSVQIFDAAGRRVLEKLWLAGQPIFEIETGKLSAGIFQIKISSRDGRFLKTLRGVKI